MGKGGKIVKRSGPTAIIRRNKNGKARARTFKGTTGTNFSGTAKKSSADSKSSSGTSSKGKKTTEVGINDVDVYNVATGSTTTPPPKKRATVHERKPATNIDKSSQNKDKKVDVKELVAIVIGASTFLTPDVAEASIRGGQVAMELPVLGPVLGLIIGVATMYYKNRNSGQRKQKPRESLVIDVTKTAEAIQTNTKLEQGLKSGQDIRLVDNASTPEAQQRFMAVLTGIITHKYKGNIEVVDAAGKTIWRKVGQRFSGHATAAWLRKYYLDNSSFVAGKRLEGIRADLAKLKKDYGIEFAEAPSILREMAAKDLSAATIPRGQTTPLISSVDFLSWMNRGMHLANTTYGNARRKTYTDVMKEFSPYADGFKLDKSDHWAKAFQTMQPWLKNPKNAQRLKQTLKNLSLDPVGSAHYEHNAFHLAKLFAENNTKTIDTALYNLNQFYAKANSKIQIGGATFNVFFESKGGSAAERQSLDNIMVEAKDYIDEGFSFKVEVTPTDKNFSSPTPDFRVEATRNGKTQVFVIEVKSFANLLGVGEKVSDYLLFLNSGYNVGKIKTGKPPIAQQIGHGLHQLHSYSSKKAGDIRILEIRVANKPTTDVLAHLQTFINQHPDSLIRIIYPETRSAGGTIKTVHSKINIIPAKNKKFDDYGRRSDQFAALEY